MSEKFEVEDLAARDSVGTPCVCCRSREELEVDGPGDRGRSAGKASGFAVEVEALDERAAGPAFGCIGFFCNAPRIEARDQIEVQAEAEDLDGRTVAGPICMLPCCQN